MLKNLEEQGTVNGASRTKQTLQSAGFRFVWQEQGVSNEREFLSIFKQRLIDSVPTELDSHVEGIRSLQSIQNLQILPCSGTLLVMHYN